LSRYNDGHGNPNLSNVSKTFSCGITVELNYFSSASEVSRTSSQYRPEKLGQPIQLPLYACDLDPLPDTEALALTYFVQFWYISPLKGKTLIGSYIFTYNNLVPTSACVESLIMSQNCVAKLSIHSF